MTLANYSVVDGGASLPLPGVSKNSYNAIVYFEKPRFGTYLAYNYRDEFVYDQGSYFGDGEFGDEYSQLDLSARFNFTDKIALTMAVTNLTDEALIRTNSFGYNRGYELNGRRTTLAVRYEF